MKSNFDPMKNIGALQQLVDLVALEDAGRPHRPVDLDRMAIRSYLNESLVSYVRARQGMQRLQSPGYAIRTLLADLVAIISQIGEYPKS